MTTPQLKIINLVVLVIIIIFNLSCSKDSDLLLDSVINNPEISEIDELNSTDVDQSIDDEISLETRVISFSPINDAHVQSGKGYNQNIIRLQEGFRTSYLMFDLSPIDSLGGSISKTSLQFTIDSDDGNGDISVYKGISNDWTEEDLSLNSAPEADAQIGFIAKDYLVGSTEIIELDPSEILPEISTFILNHKDGNDLAFASKEHISKIGPKLVVTYEVPAGSEDINIEEETDDNEEVQEATEDENEAPIAVLSVNAYTGEAPLTVQFTGNKSTDDKQIISYLYDFKDGETATNIDPAHIFSNPGTYEVEFTVKDQEGLSDTEKITINVRAASNNNEGSNGEYPANAIYASSYGFNSADATNALKEAINSTHPFIVIDKQASDWIVGPLFFSNIKNKTIVFESGVVLRAKTGAFPAAHRLLQFTYSDNITILGYGATLRMNKSEYTSGEQRHALSIVNSSNITIKGLTLRDSGGDGLYISRYNHGEYCRNILVEDIIATNNKRQGMSVISVDGLTVRNSSFTNTAGKAPGAGVDFEPESTLDRLVKIRFIGCTFTGNEGPGIQFALAKTSSSTMPLDAVFTDSYVSNNYSPSNEQGSYPSEIDLGMSINNNSNPIKGKIVFDGLRVENSKWSAIWSKKTLEAYHVTIKNAVIKNVSTSSNLAAIHVGLLSYGNTSYANMGGYTFENVLIDYDGVDASLELFGPGHGNWNLREMHGTIRVKSPSGVGFEDNLNRLVNNTSSTVDLQIIPD